MVYSGVGPRCNTSVLECDEACWLLHGKSLVLRTFDRIRGAINDEASKPAHLVGSSGVTPGTPKYEKDS